ncbi:MAG: formate dehydrogenase subunit delta [Hyphomicrobiales bacterium]
MSTNQTAEMGHHETHKGKLLRMAHQITAFFESYPEEQGVAAIAEHINKFWHRTMRDEFVNTFSESDPALKPLLRKAMPKIKSTAPRH